MKAVLLDLPSRDAFALSLLIGKMRPEWRCQAAHASSAPSGDLFVLDLLSLNADGAESDACVDARLAALLGPRPAVLLTPSVPAREDARAAADQQATRWAARGWTVLRRPFSATAMQQALEQAERHMAAATGAAVGLPPSRATPPAAAEHVATAATTTVPADPPTTYFSTSMFSPALDDPTNLQRMHDMSLPELGDGSLTLTQFRASLDSSPHTECISFMQTLTDWLTAGLPFEMSLTMINGLIFHPGENWVANNTPLPVLRMVCRSRALVRHVKLMPLNERIHPATRAEQRGMRTHSLGDMLYVLAYMAECRLPG